MKTYIMGFVLGLVILLPGMSGGTALLLMGIYEDLLKDLAKFKILKYYKLILGSIFGIYVGSVLFAFLFENHRDLTMAVLLGGLLASIKSIVNKQPCCNIKLFGLLIVGIAIGYLSSSEPSSGQVIEDVQGWLLIVAGALASAAMIIPGVPGSSVLIFFGIYEEVMFYVSTVALLPLSLLLIGSIIGGVFLVKILAIAYEHYKGQLSYFFSGIILGSSKMLFPETFSIEVFVLLLVSFGLTFFLAQKFET